MATPVNAKPRQRAWRPKARTGCKTCKIRKVKCDEEKPNCRRCYSTGRTCDGYDPDFRPRTPSPPSKSPGGGSAGPVSVRNSASRSPSPAQLVPALKLDTVEERESFAFFTTHAVASLCGFLDSSFWQREVLQAVHHEPAVQHCVIALGAMHRRFYQGKGSHLIEKDMSDKYLQFALRQSNQAIQDLLKSQASKKKLKQADTVTLMTCCILFASMSCLQGHNRDAFAHLKSGIRMLDGLEEQEHGDTQDDHPVNIDSLRSLFVGLDMQARSIMPARSVRENWITRPKAGSSSKLPGKELSMVSLLAMQGYMESLLGEIHNFFQDADGRSIEDAPEIYRGYSDIVRRCQQGASALETLCESDRANDHDFAQPVGALRLLQCMIDYMLQHPVPDVRRNFERPGSLEFDALFPDSFDAAAKCFNMFELATRLLPLSSSTAAPVFTTSMGPIAALWLVAMKAPSSCGSLRNRAVQLMLKHPRREGFWDGMIAGQIAQEALKLEAESVQADSGVLAMSDCGLVVPDDLRIGIVRISYDGVNDRRAMVEFCNSRDVAAGLPGRTRCVNW